MGKAKQNPRNNVICLRVSDDELERLQAVCKGGTRQEFLHAATMFALALREAPAVTTVKRTNGCR